MGFELAANRLHSSTLPFAPVVIKYQEDAQFLHSPATAMLQPRFLYNKTC